MERLAAEDPHWIGDFRLLGRLGEGGMGRVYLARSRRGRTVAVKVVKSELARQPDFRRRFSQEITAARRVGGTWTAPVFDADTEAETPWVATGYIAGPSLAEVVDEQFGPLPAQSVSTLASGLTRALQDIHGAGLVHRDLKPSNVLVTIDGPRVIDFGIARALDSAVQSSGGLTRTGALVGSPGFMSPEQVRGRQVTPASDIFCLGAVLAYAATGRMPFGTADSGVHALLFRIAEEEPELSGLSGELLELVASCLAKAPEDRPDLDALSARTEGELSAAWLPGEVLAELGRHAVQLLDSEDPEGSGETQPGLASSPTPAAAPSTPPPDGRPPAGAYGPPASTPPYAAAAQQPWAHSPVAGSFSAGGAFPSPGHGPASGPGPAPGPAPGPSGPGPGTPPPVGRLPAATPARQPSSPRKLAQGITVLMSLVLLVHVIGLIMNAIIDDTLETAEGAFGGTELSAVKGFEGLKGATVALEFVSVPVVIALAVVWLVWFWRVRVNAETFSPGGIRYTPSMAVVAWFLPVCNLVIPKQVVNDVWAASNPAVPQGYGFGPRPASKRGVVNTWWILWVVYLCLGSVNSAESWYDAVSINEGQRVVAVSLFTDLSGIPAAILAMVFVTRLSRLQDDRLTGR